MIKKIILSVFLIFILTACSSNTQKEEVIYTNELKWPKTQSTIYVTADFHWQIEGANFRIEYLDEKIDALLDEAVKDEPMAFLVCGDITNGGKLEEHTQIAAILKEAENKGLNVFVTMGNHDMDSNISSDTIKEIYADFGFNTAISSDTNTMSYLSKLNDEIWLLSLDFNLYDGKESEMAAFMSDETLLWIEECLIKAENEGAMVIPFSHHNLVEFAQGDLGVHYNIENGEKLQQLLLNYSVPVYFSGHRHSSFTASVENKDRRIDELVVDMPSNYPFRYTSITFNPDFTIDQDIKRLDIENYARENSIDDEILLNFNEYSIETYTNQLIENASAISKLTDDEEEVEKLANYYVEILTAAREKTLWEESETLKEDEALDLWKKYADKNIFGRWIPWILENQTNDKEQQTLGPYR